MNHSRLGEQTRLGGVRLQVADLDRSLRFYRDLLGFRELGRPAGSASLGVPGGSRPLVTLVERSSIGRVPPRGRLGLFHFAILLPTRGALGSILAHLNAHHVQPGMSDHLVSEALYLSDPDGLGIEIYADRPRSAWTRRGDELMMATEPLDVEGLLRETGAGEWQGMPAGTSIGHIHLHVGDLVRAEEFYATLIGFDVVVRSYPGALFMSAGGYHHHLGTNTWARGATAPPPDEAQLLDWELVVADRMEVQAIGQRLRAGGATASGEADGVLIARDPFGTSVRILAA